MKAKQLIYPHKECPTCGHWDWRWGCMRPKRLGKGATVKFPCGAGKKSKEVTITPQVRQQLKKGLVQRTKVRRRKEDARRQHIYK